MSKSFQEAGVAFQKTAECHLQLKSKHEAASAFQNAATCFAKVNPGESINCLERAIELFVDEGRFQAAAKHEQQIGEMLEEQGDMDAALEHFETAADYFEGEGQKSAASKVKIKVADYCALAEKYAKAIEIYEETGIAYLANNLLKWSAKELFFKVRSSDRFVLRPCSSHCWPAGCNLPFVLGGYGRNQKSHGQISRPGRHLCISAGTVLLAFPFFFFTLFPLSSL